MCVTALKRSHHDDYQYIMCVTALKRSHHDDYQYIMCVTALKRAHHHIYQYVIDDYVTSVLSCFGRLLPLPFPVTPLCSQTTHYRSLICVLRPHTIGHSSVFSDHTLSVISLCVVAGDLADLILVFFDPIGQALCKRTLNLVEKMNEKHADRIHFYLSKADEAGDECDRQVPYVCVCVCLNVFVCVKDFVCKHVCVCVQLYVYMCVSICVV